MPSKASLRATLTKAQATVDSAAAAIRATAAAAEAGKQESAAGLQKAREMDVSIKVLHEAMREAGRKEGVPHTPKTAITLPAGTPLRSEGIGDILKSDAVISCDERDAWLLRAALGLPDPNQRSSTSTNHFDPRASIPCQEAALPEMSTTKASSLESKNCKSQSRTCFGVSSVSTIQVVVNLLQ